MSFTWPLVLLALLALPLLGLLYWFQQRRRAKFAVRFTNLDLLANVVGTAPGWKRHLPPALYLLALGALTFALARPHTSVNVPKEEATVVLVMDVSGSMRAVDVEPTRLDAARDAARTLVEKLPESFQVALVSFSNNVSTVVPPTTDREAFYEGIKALRADRGTAMGDGIIQALDLVRPLELPDSGAQPGAAPTPRPSGTPPKTTDDRPAILVLLSDGANSAGFADPIDAANEASARGISVYTVALGTAEGVVDVTDNLGRTRRIQVPPDEQTLQEIADITDARFFAAPSAKELESVYKDLGSKIGFDKEDREITVIFAGIAAALVVAAGAVSLIYFNRFP